MEKMEQDKDKIKTVIFGSDSIEFGWAVSTWIPAMRFAARRFKRVVAVCNERNRYLYEDFATDFEFYEQKGKHDMWYVGRRPDILPKVPKRIRRKYEGATYYVPSRNKCLDWPRLYHRYGMPDPGKKYDLVIHARAETKYEQTDRNWPVEYYEMMLRLLDKPMRICSIGTKAHHIPGTDDLRGIDLKSLCDILTSSCLCIGPSSGPMHLAHACACPILVWTDWKKQRAIKTTNRVRYLKLWRANDSQVTIYDSEDWQPQPRSIANKIKELL